MAQESIRIQSAKYAMVLCNFILCQRGCRVGYQDFVVAADAFEKYFLDFVMCRRFLRGGQAPFVVTFGAEIPIECGDIEPGRYGAAPAGVALFRPLPACAFIGRNGEDRIILGIAEGRCHT